MTIGIILGVPKAKRAAKSKAKAKTAQVSAGIQRLGVQLLTSSHGQAGLPHSLPCQLLSKKNIVATIYSQLKGFPPSKPKNFGQRYLSLPVTTTNIVIVVVLPREGAAWESNQPSGYDSTPPITLRHRHEPGKQSVDPCCAYQYFSGFGSPAFSSFAHSLPVPQAPTHQGSQQHKRIGWEGTYTHNWHKKDDTTITALPPSRQDHHGASWVRHIIETIRLVQCSSIWSSWNHN